MVSTGGGGGGTLRVVRTGKMADSCWGTGIRDQFGRAFSTVSIVRRRVEMICKTYRRELVISQVFSLTSFRLRIPGTWR